MTGSIKFTALAGCREEGGGRCYVLEVDNIKIMLDAGVDPVSMDCSMIEDYVRSNKVDAVLISHGDLVHCGALPAICSLLDSEVPIFATTPIHHLGRQALIDARQAWKERFGLIPNNMKGINAAFDRIKALRYSQPIPITNKEAVWLGGAGDSITVMAMPAGHSLGGAMWRIRKAAGEDIVYAVDFDHRRGVCLDGAAFDLLVRPTCLITDCRQALVVNEVRKERDALFFGHLKSLLNPKSSNTVIIPIEPATMSLEVLLMFERYWTDNKIQVPLYFMSLCSPQKTIDLAKGMLEWMGPGMMKSFDEKRENPFDLEHVKLVSRPGDLSTQATKVVLASMPNLSAGCSLQLLMNHAQSSHCHVLFLEQPQLGSIGYELLKCSNELTITLNESQPLDGNELIKYRKEQQELKEQQLAEVAFAKMQQRSSSRNLINSDSDTDEEDHLEQTDANADQEIKSVRALSEIFWSDYKSDWWNDMEYANDPFNLPSQRFQVFSTKNSVKITNSEYGQLVPIDAFKEHSLVTVSHADDQDLVTQARLLINKKREEEEEEAVSTEPVKWISIKKKLAVKCHRKVFPGFSGLSDGRSLRNIIGQVAPRRLILIGGSVEATDYLYNHYLYSLSTSGLNQVIAPSSCNVPFELSTSTASHPASLSETLTETVKIQTCGDYQLAHILGSLSIQSHQTKIGPLPTLPPSSPVMIGDIKIGEFRKAVQDSLQLSAEFVRGDLLIGGGNVPQILLRKMDEAEWSLEGQQSKEYELVRDLFYEHLAII